MGQEVVNSKTLMTGLQDAKAPANRRPLEYAYTKELLLSFAELASCKSRPENLDPVVWRDAPAADSREVGIAVPAIGPRGMVRRDRDGEPFGKAPAEVPEWRKDSWRSGGSGTSLHQASKRNPYDEDYFGNSSAGSYPPRPAGTRVDSKWNSHERALLQGQGSVKWDNRAGPGDREREYGRHFQRWEGEEAAPVVSLDAPRSDGPWFGSGGPFARSGWISAERDGLLGSGGGLHRTYTGNFNSPSSLRVGADRQMSLGFLDRQIGLGPLDRQNSMRPIDSQGCLAGVFTFRNNEPQHLPHTLKGPVFVRREDTDFVDDETFGSEVSSSDDRAEQEQKRRESFEAMRKDHQRHLQEQQKLMTQKHEARLANPKSNVSRKHDESRLWDSPLSAVEISLSSPKSPLNGSGGSKELVSSGVSISPPTPSTPPPAIPPGFAKVLQQTHTTSKGFLLNETSLEGNNFELNDSSKQIRFHSEFPVSSEDSIDDGSTVDVKPLHQPIAADSKPTTFSGPFDVISSVQAIDSSENKSTADVIRGDFRLDNVQQGVSKYERTENGVGENDKSQESLLDKLFGRSKSVQGIEGGVLSILSLTDESQDWNRKELWSGGDSKMSKFAQLFHQEEIQLIDGQTSSANSSPLFPKGESWMSLASLPKNQAVPNLSQRDNVMSWPSNHHGRILPMPSGPSLVDIEKGLIARANSSKVQVQSVDSSLVGALSFEKLGIELERDTLIGECGKHSTVENFGHQPPTPKLHSSQSPIFFTCEDIEQSMLAEAGTTVEENSHRLSLHAEVSILEGAKNEQAGVQASDYAASHYLLSLLHKGTVGRIQFPESSRSSFTERKVLHKTPVNDRSYDEDDLVQRNFAASEVEGSSKTTARESCTLETLFGKAFMNELRSSEAPVSAHYCANGYDSNIDKTKTLSGLYPGIRQASARLKNVSPNSDVTKQWLRPLGPLSDVGWTESNLLEFGKHGHIIDRPAVSKVDVIINAKLDSEESRPVSSFSGVQGNGVNVKSLPSDGSLRVNTDAGMKFKFLSSVENTFYDLGDIKENSVEGTGHISSVHSLELATNTGMDMNVHRRSSPCSNLASGQLRFPDLATFRAGLVKASSVGEPVMCPSTSFDSTVLFPVSEDSLPKTENSSTDNFKSSDLAGVMFQENSFMDTHALDRFLFTSKKLNQEEVMENGLAGDNLSVGDDMNTENVRYSADTPSDTLRFIGKMKDGNSCVPSGFSEKALVALVGSESTPVLFKSNIDGIQPVSGHSAFQSVSPQLQHPQASGPVNRSEPSAFPVHHTLQTHPNSMPLSMFSQQSNLQSGVPQQQNLLARAYSNGSSLGYPHGAFGLAPIRTLQAGQLYFSPTSLGHVPRPSTYYSMGHMGPTPVQFQSIPQMAHRGSVMPPVADSHLFLQEQSLHDFHGLATKPVAQQGRSIYPIGGRAVQLGQVPMPHQSSQQDLHGQQSQSLSGPRPYSFDLTRTVSNSHEVAGYANRK